jgi:hypothetical protein
MRTLALARAVVCAGAAVLGACGGGGGDAEVRTSAPQGPRSVEQDAATASSVLLTVADLPGYDLLRPGDADSSSLQAASSFESCAGAAAALGDVDRSALSPAFYKGTSVMVSSLAVVAASEAEARQAMSDLSRKDLAGCLTALFRSVLGLDVAPGTTAATELLPSKHVADQSATWRTTIQVTSGPSTVAAYSDLTFFRSGRTVAVLFDIQGITPFPAEERQRLLDVMVDRASAD